MVVVVAATVVEVVEVVVGVGVTCGEHANRPATKTRAKQLSHIPSLMSGCIIPPLRFCGPEYLPI